MTQEAPRAGQAGGAPAGRSILGDRALGELKEILAGNSKVHSEPPKVQPPVRSESRKGVVC